jgi:hypothetical protein
VGTLTRHYERAKNSQGEYIKFGNEEIDPSKTHLNYNLAPDRNQAGFVRERCAEVKCLNREDVKVMCSWIVTAPKDLPEADNALFFRETYEFLKNRYGGERNVVSAYVHMDETTPHLHFAFVPVTVDRKKGIEKVSAKEVLARKDLQSFHQDLEAHHMKVFGRDVGVLNEATKDGNKAVAELKKETAMLEAKQAQHEAEEARAEAEALKSEIKPYQEIKGKMEFIDVAGRKALLPGYVTIKKEELDKLKEQAKAFVANHEKIVTLAGQQYELGQRQREFREYSDKILKSLSAQIA